MPLNKTHFEVFIKSYQGAQSTVGHSPYDWYNSIKHNRICNYENVITTTLPNTQLSRLDLFNMAKADSGYDTLSVCISILAWGGMNRSHAKCLFEGNQRWLQVAHDIRKSAPNNVDYKNTYKAFSALREASKLKGMGVAYFTKLIYFLSQNTNSGGFILDQWTATSVNLLFDDQVVITQPGKIKLTSGGYRYWETVSDRNTEDNYQRFCECILELSEKSKLSPDLVEQMMFSRGRGKGLWRNYLIKNRAVGSTTV